MRECAFHKKGLPTSITKWHYESPHSAIRLITTNAEALISFQIESGNASRQRGQLLHQVGFLGLAAVLYASKLLVAHSL